MKRCDAGEVRNSVLEGLKAGVRHIDCAWIYGNENEVGSAIAQAFREGIVRREDVFITSKLWNTFHDPGPQLPSLFIALFPLTYRTLLPLLQPSLNKA